MDTIELTSLSSKGQIVIPQKIRKAMKLRTGKTTYKYQQRNYNT